MPARRALGLTWQAILLRAMLPTLLVGCEVKSSFDSVGMALPASEAPVRMAESDGKMGESVSHSGGDAALAWGGQGQSEAPPAVPLVRKIIYTADVSLIVKDFDAAETALLALIAEHDGQIAQSDLGASSGVRRTGKWRIRIPVERYEAFLRAANKLGEMERSKLDSQDVTEEFYDVQARIKNKKVEEERLLQHLKETAGKLEEILAVEKELSRVRGEIEGMQGRLNLLANLTSLTTINITLREIKDYVPPSAPTFATRVGRAFENSWLGLVRFGENLVIYAAAAVVWLPLVGLACGGILWFFRSPRKRVTSTTESTN